MRTLAILAALLVAAPCASAVEVSIVLSDDGPAYVEAAQAVESRLSALAKVQRVPVEGLDRPGRAPAAVVTLGARAFQAALASAQRVQIVAALIPRAAYEQELKRASRSANAPPTAVFLDQPLGRQLDLVRIVLPSPKRIGLLVSPATEKLVRPMESAARLRGLVIVHESVADPSRISPSLVHVLEGSDVLLALPDPSIYNAGTIHNILLTSLRMRRPLIGFSEAYVRAGALAAVYSRPQQAGRQAAEIVARTIGGAALPPPQDPQAFAVRVNHVLAQSLGLAIPAEEVIHEMLQRMERER
ncbi:MAG TPA: ABC transporter substrate binding protein [Burkholderiales bacterium]|nr:ABC transporter substrate binding protein [Burkholderiales bacterium]